MKRLLIAVFLTMVVIGCTTYSQLFVNASGQIMRCSATGQGLVGMAVAGNAYSKCVEDFKKAGYIELEKAGVVGVTFSQVTPDTIARIIRVQPNSPAKKMGLRVGDVIKFVDEEPVASYHDAQQMMFGLANTEVVLGIVRHDSTQSISLVRAPYTQVYGTGRNTNDDQPPEKFSD